MPGWGVLLLAGIMIVVIGAAWWWADGWEDGIDEYDDPENWGDGR